MNSSRSLTFVRFSWRNLSLKYVMSQAQANPEPVINEKDLSDLRKAYRTKEDAIRNFPYENPFVAFDEWFHLISKECESYEETNGFALATATEDRLPSIRWLLMKSYSSDGFKFFTNYMSRKGLELAVNPNAALAFYWSKVNKSVRVEGKVEKVSVEESDLYWNKRPRGSQSSAAISDQSSVIEFSGNELDEKIAEIEEQYKDKPIPRPQNWGGYLLKPERFEFWAGQTTRLHDRFVFRRKGEGETLGEHSKLCKDGWVLERLAP